MYDENGLCNKHDCRLIVDPSYSAAELFFETFATLKEAIGSPCCNALYAHHETRFLTSGLFFTSYFRSPNWQRRATLIGSLSNHDESDDDDVK